MSTANEIEIHDIEGYLRSTVEFRRKANVARPDNYKYEGMEHFVLERGEAHKSEPLTAEEMEIVIAAVDTSGTRFKMKECFYNAQLLALYDPSTELVYHEGYAAGLAGVPMLHGWVTINGKVVDVTWRLDKRRSKGRLRDRIFGTIPEGWEYMGVGFQTEFLRERIVRRGQIWSVIDDWQEQWPAVRGDYG